MFASKIAMTSQFENGLISVGVESCGGENEIEIPTDIDESKVLQNSVEGRLELENDVEFVENSKLVVNGLKYRYAKIENGNLVAKLRGCKEFKIFYKTEIENRYVATNDKGKEFFGNVIFLESKIENSDSVEKINKPAYVNLVCGIDKSKLVPVKSKRMKADRNYNVYEFENNYYTIQGKGGAVCLWTHISGNFYSRTDSKGNIINAELIDFVENEFNLGASSKEKIENKGIFPKKNISVPKYSGWQPTYSWLKV